MSNQQTYRHLEAAQICLERSIDELTTADHAVTRCPPYLQQAAESLLGIERSDLLRGDRDRIGGILLSLATRAQTATRLLESAENSYTGRILCNRVAHVGYTPEGAPESMSTGISMSIEG